MDPIQYITSQGDLPEDQTAAGLDVAKRLTQNCVLDGYESYFKVSGDLAEFVTFGGYVELGRHPNYMEISHFIAARGLCRVLVEVGEDPPCMLLPRWKV